MKEISWGAEGVVLFIIGGGGGGRGAKKQALVSKGL